MGGAILIMVARCQKELKILPSTSTYYDIKNKTHNDDNNRNVLINEKKFKTNLKKYGM